MIIQSKQSGIALVIVLWMLTLLAILALSYSANTRVEIKLTAHLVQTAKANALAEAGIWQAVSELLKPPEEQAWQTDGSINQVDFAGGEINIRIQDETGKIDLNSARTELLHNLIISLDITIDNGERLQLLQAILDWRDKDNLVRRFGAEDDEYLTAGFEYGAKDGPFNTLSELQLVAGMTPEIFKKMEPALTIHSHQPGINPEVAPREVLLALLGVSAELVDEYMLNRTDSPFNKLRELQLVARMTPEIYKKEVLLALPDVSAELVDEYMLSRTDGRDSSFAASLPGIDSRYFSKARGRIFKITSEGLISESINRIDAIVLIKRNSNMPYIVLSWQENSTYNSEDVERQGS